jgi:hypothetical protein
MSATVEDHPSVELRVGDPPLSACPDPAARQLRSKVKLIAAV